MTHNSLELDLSPARLRHIRWIGGGSGACKSTVSRQLAEKHGLRLYTCDEKQSSHTARSNPVDHPLLHTFLATTMDERWAQRTPEEMFRTFHGYQGEGFELLLEDLLEMPTDQLILVLALGPVALPVVRRPRAALRLPTLDPAQPVALPSCVKCSAPHFHTSLT